MNRRKFLELLGKGAALLGIAPLVRIPELQPLSEAHHLYIREMSRDEMEKFKREWDEYLTWDGLVKIAWNGKGEEWRKHPGGEWEKTRDGWPN